MSRRRKRERVASSEAALEALSNAAVAALQSVFHVMVPVAHHLERTQHLMELMQETGFMEDPSDAAIQAREHFLARQIADARSVGVLIQDKAMESGYPLEEQLEAFNKLRYDLGSLDEMRVTLESLDAAGLDALIEDLFLPRDHGAEE